VVVGRSQRAISALSSTRFLQPTQKSRKIQVLMPELFCCRNLGDGFGSIINALMSALENLNGSIPTLCQMRAILAVTQSLRESYF